jgi:hypothetical protein
VEAAVQLMLAAGTERLDITAWAASGISRDIALGGRAGALRLRLERMRLLDILARRAHE